MQATHLRAGRAIAPAPSRHRAPCESAEALLCPLRVGISRHDGTLHRQSARATPSGRACKGLSRQSTARFRSPRNSPQRSARLSIRKPDSMFWWFLDLFAQRERSRWQWARTGRRHDYPWTPMNGLRVSAVGGGGCGEITGRYVVREIVYQPDGSVLRFAADFEQHCEDACSRRCSGQSATTRPPAI